MTPVAEFNIWHDPEAAAMALAAAGDLDIPVTMYGLDVYDAPQLTGDDIHRRRRPGDPGAELAAMAVAELCRQHDLVSSTIGDAGAVCAVADPTGLVTRRHGVWVDAGLGIGRGQTVVDRRASAESKEWNPLHRAATPVDVAFEIDADRYVALWLDTVCGPRPAGGAR
jgi:pyrimidine-specific ribonucleoside hydrolase